MNRIEFQIWCEKVFEKKIGRKMCRDTRAIAAALLVWDKFIDKGTADESGNSKEKSGSLPMAKT